MDRSHGVILLGLGISEERPQPLSGELVEGALVPEDDLRHGLEERVQKLLNLFGLQAFNDLPETGYLCGEHAQLLSLAAEPQSLRVG